MKLRTTTMSLEDVPHLANITEKNESLWKNSLSFG